MRTSSDNASGIAPVFRSPQRRRGRDRVASLTAAAAALFVEKGFEATTMTEIAARAGASIGSLYLFFPTKAALARAMLTQLSECLSVRLDRLQARSAGWPATRIADALFEEMLQFVAAHPVYATLFDIPGEDDWKQAVRARRREQVTALFSQAAPALAEGQPERLALIVPQLLRVALALASEPSPMRDATRQELRDMLRHHLEQQKGTESCVPSALSARTESFGQT